MEAFFFYYCMVCFFLFGLVVGSFLNVCIFRIPKGETVVTVPSHCTSCGHKLVWYDLFPFFSYLFLGGKCRYCKAKISVQYPIVELLNALLWVVIYIVFGGLSVTSVIYCLFASALVVISVIDIRDGIIPDRINAFIFILGIIITALDYNNWAVHIIGFFAVSVPLLVPLFIKGMGGGDVKLFAVCGLLVGWKLIVLTLVAACFLGTAFSIFIMIKNKATGKTAVKFGPFISLGLLISVVWGEQIINWYLQTFFYV